MHADGVEVLHAADGDRVARAVAHHLELDLLPSGDVALHEDLGDGGEREPGARDDAQLPLVFGHAAARAAQRERRARDDGVADVRRGLHGLLHRGGDLRGDDGLAQLFHRVAEKPAVLGLVDGLGGGAEEPDPRLFQVTLPAELHRDGEPRLPAQRSEQAVRALLFDDALHRRGGERLQVDLVRKRRVRHDGGGVRIDEHHVEAGLLQHAAGLVAGVVELGGLADHDGPGADHEHFFDLPVQRHQSVPPFIRARKRSKAGRMSRGPAWASGWNCMENARRPG